MTAETKKFLLYKITSKKFWVAIAGVVTAIMVILGADGDTIQSVVGLIGAIGTVAVYMRSETDVDIARIRMQESTPTSGTPPNSEVTPDIE